MKAIVVGGGIGGFTAALCLREQGLEVALYERTAQIQELGVGINMLPHATKVLVNLGLLERLDAVAIQTRELIFANRFGQRIWREPRGLDAGYDYPQFSIHRGHLQGVLHDAVRERLGDGAVHAGHDLVEVTQDDGGVTARFRVEGGGEATVRGDLLVGADGIHSRTRETFYPGEGPPDWSGRMFWRGAAEWEPFLTGRSMIIAGGMFGKLVLYPLSNAVQTPGKTLMNWAVFKPTGEPGTEPPRRERWDRRGRIEELLPFVQETFHMDVLDVPALIEATEEFFEYPVCDREPIDRWSFGRVTLLGDAAHPMYPMGSNGASQAIIDARVLANLVAGGDSVEAALAAYDAERIPKTSEVVRRNRHGGNERVIDLVASRAPDGFDRLEDVVSQDELAAVVGDYTALAGFDLQTVNR